MVDTSGSVVQSTDYYPFGLAHATSSLDKNKYLYNGKELQSEVLGGTAFDMLDYGARFYDPVVARWHGVDPLAAKFETVSPFNYGLNNPVVMVDKDGKRADWWQNGQTGSPEYIENKKVWHQNEMASRNYSYLGEYRLDKSVYVSPPI